MYAHFSEGLSCDHVPAHATGNRRYCVGDGVECLAVHRTESEAMDHARRLNREGDTDCYKVYCCDLDERDDTGEFVYPHERRAAGLDAATPITDEQTADDFATISIAMDGVWAGSGKLRDGTIQDCGAQFCDDNDASLSVYPLIEAAIAAGLDDLVTMIDGTQRRLTWTIVERQ